MVRHRWPAGARFAFICYNHWAQLLLRWQGKDPIVILIMEGFTQGYPLSMILYGITIFPIIEEFRSEYPELLSSFYAVGALFHGPASRSTRMMTLLL